MKLLFLTLIDIYSIEEHNIYTDLLREFRKNGHEVYVISPTERRNGESTHIITEDRCTILKLRIGNIQKTNIIEKGISTVMIEPAFKKAIKKFFSNVKFDLILYSTPPITLVSAIEYVKKRDDARTYLLLKDIFPQNAVDIGMITTVGIKGILYKHFRRQEKGLYKISDRIGCMSQANVDYLLEHNSEVKLRQKESIQKTGKPIVEVCPNSIEVIDKSVNEETRKQIRIKYNIPLDKKVFVYGGNLGRPQGIPFFIECLKKSQDLKDVYFLIVGDGTEYHILQKFVEEDHPENVRLMKQLPRDDYETMVGACDIGMIFLDHRFTIPNFPSRLLSYMQAKLPVLAVTDPNTDIGRVIVDGKFGWWCESNDACKFTDITIKTIEDRHVYGENAYLYALKHYSVEQSCKTILFGW